MAGNHLGAGNHPEAGKPLAEGTHPPREDSPRPAAGSPAEVGYPAGAGSPGLQSTAAGARSTLVRPGRRPAGEKGAGDVKSETDEGGTCGRCQRESINGNCLGAKLL